jgi:hypothetical protein
MAAVRRAAAWLPWFIRAGVSMGAAWCIHHAPLRLARPWHCPTLPACAD